jgi:phage gp46-like protein
MSDIATLWDAASIRGDWQMQDAALAAGDDLITAVLISLFTDRVAAPGDTIPDGTSDRRGWWGDIRVNGVADPIGSRLWLLSRRKQDQKTLNDALTHAREALQWLITDGVAANVDVAAQWNGRGYLAMQVTIERRNGTVLALAYDWAWKELN